MYRVRTVLTGVVGSPWYTNIHFDDQAAGGPEAAVDAVYGFWDALRGSMMSQVAWTIEGDVPAISPGTGQIESVFSVPSRSGTGNASGDALPWATQGLVRLRTGAFFGGREIRGRIFVPGLSEMASGSGVPTAAFVTSLGVAAQALLDAPDATPVVYSRKNFIQSPVSSATAAPYWAVLRSRRD